jgi:hypothetical protein
MMLTVIVKYPVVGALMSSFGGGCSIELTYQAAGAYHSHDLLNSESEMVPRVRWFLEGDGS